MTCHHGPDTCGPDGCEFQWVENAIDAVAGADDSWQPLVDDDCVRPCGCRHFAEDGDWYKFCGSPQCQEDFEADCRSDELLLKFDQVVLEGFLSQRGPRRAYPDVIADFAATRGEAWDAYVAESGEILNELAAGEALKPWFFWLVEQADAHSDMRLPWPMLLDDALRDSPWTEDLRPRGVYLSHNTDASAEQYVRMVIASLTAQ